MRASEAIRGAMANRVTRPESHANELWFEWQGQPGWRMLRYVAAIRSLLGDLFGCDVLIAASGPGCFFAVYAIPLPAKRFEDLMNAGARDELRLLVEQFEVHRLRVKTQGRTSTIFA
jgi:hypothetical protein